MSGVAHRLRTIYRPLAERYREAVKSEMELLPDVELRRIANYEVADPQEAPTNNIPARPYPPDGLTRGLDDLREISPDLADRIVDRLRAGGLESVLQRRSR